MVRVTAVAQVLVGDDSAHRTNVTYRHGVAEGLANVRLLDFTGQICGKRRCSPVSGNILVYRDTNHLTKTFAQTLTPRFESVLSDLAPQARQATDR